MRLTIRILAAALVCAPLAGVASAPPASAQTLIEDPRYAAILIDVDAGEVLYERRADLLRHPASITKVMTLYLAFDALETGRLRLDDRVEMTPAAVRQPPSKIGLGLGQSLTVEQAIRLIAIKSANDIAVALGERIAGSHEQFVALMNARAAQLGMTRTSFANATGLPHPDNLTTARDIATLAQQVILNHGPRYRYFSEQYVDWQGRPLAGKPATVTCYQREWYTTQTEDPAGYREFTSVPSDTEVSRVSITTGPKGKATAVFTPALGLLAIILAVATSSRLFRGLPITVLENRVAWLDIEGRRLVLVGVAMDEALWLDRQALGRIVPTLPKEGLRILLYHSPDLLPEAAAAGFHLYPTGHTHGGQIRLPFYGALVTPSEYGKRYEMGPYREGSTLAYVCRGIGMEGWLVPRMRFLCPPEIVLYEIE